MTDEKREQHIRALVEERDGYAAKGNARMVAVVEAQLERLAANAVPPAKRAQKRAS